jgi:high affinity Mn2+ porin
MVLTPGLAAAVESESPSRPSWIPRLLGIQANFVYQDMPGFHNPYQGDKSLTYDNGLGRQLTQVYGIYLGSQVTRSLQVYLDAEMFRGDGISDGMGLGGYVNGDVIRAGSADLGQGPYIARLFLRYVISLSGSEIEIPERAIDQMPRGEARKQN